MPIGANQEWERAHVASAQAGIDAFLLSSLADVTYVSGFEVPIPIGAGAEFAYGIPLAFCTVGDPHGWLVVPDGMAAQARSQSRLDEWVTFDTFNHLQQTDSAESFVGAIRSTLRGVGLGSSRATLGIQARTLPYAVARLLQEEFPALALVEISPALLAARSIKTQREIDLLRFQCAEIEGAALVADDEDDSLDR